MTVTPSDLNKPILELVNLVQSSPNPTAPFAVLLARVSRDAAATAAKLIVLTRWLIGLTVIVVLLTAPLVYIEVAKYFSDLPQSPLKQQQHNSSAGKDDQNIPAPAATAPAKK
jgi:hypothetical protein